MRAVLQRVTSAWVTSAEDHTTPGVEVGRIGPGLLVLVGVTDGDDQAAAERLADKLWGLRVFPDADGVMNVSCADAEGEVLVISQFTLYGDTRKGRRPSYVAAARPEVAEPLIEAVVARLRDNGARVQTGRFRTHMQVGSVNDGPVTLLVEV